MLSLVHLIYMAGEINACVRMLVSRQFTEQMSIFIIFYNLNPLPGCKEWSTRAVAYFLTRHWPIEIK